jgi:predicted TIM-barrel fold metal-dependent hydrolase
VSHKAIQKLYDVFGPTKLVWGSDAPNIERYCTYAQSLKYLTHYCDFITPEDKKLIVGKNLQKIFRVAD